jgi:hypothetical protein
MRCPLAIALIFAAAYSCGADMVVVNVHQSNDVIRAHLLRETPVGTPATQVYQFLQHRLRHAPGAEVVGAPGQPYRSTMSIHLGRYFTAESLFTFGPMVVQAFWRFDEHDKLRDIEVRRVLTGL